MLLLWFITTMVFPTREAHEALVNEVKTLKEENKRLKEEGNRSTDRPARTTANRFSNLTSPFEEPHIRAFDIENPQHEDTMDEEPLLFKILCFCAGVYPILKKDGKWDITWKTIGWCIFPLIYTGYWGVYGPIVIIANTQDGMKMNLYQQIYYLRLLLH